MFYSDSAPLETMVKRWYADFKHGCTDTNDAECLGHPNLAVGNDKLKLCEIVEKMNISKGRKLLRKLCSKWVMHLLTVDQKQQRIDDSEHCLQLFHWNKKEFLHKYGTMDETWIHHFTPESNGQSAEQQVHKTASDTNTEVFH